MNKIKCSTGRIEFVLCTALLGALAGRIYAQPGPLESFIPPPRIETSVSVGLPGVEIRAESDFYEPLTPYGRWEVVGSYGRCWIPGRVEADWRPYSEGYWQRTDAGWYWVSEEPWAWATYHYGRWDLSPQFGWYWVPQTQWAPAWVSWHSGGGYIGWAPLYPSSRFGRGESLQVDMRVISPRAYVFVEQRHFLEPVRRSTLVVNNTTIINKTVNITNVKVVNNTVINEGPKTQVIEQASKRKVQEVPVRELRRKQEAPVVARQQNPVPTPAKKERTVQTPVRSEVESSARKAVAASAPSQAEKPVVTPRAPAPPSPTGRVPAIEKSRPIPTPAEPRTETPRPSATKETTPKPAKYSQPSEQPEKKSEKKTSAQPVPEQKNGKAEGQQGHNQKGEHPTPESP